MERTITRTSASTSFIDHEHIAAAIQAGAIGYVLQDVSPDELATAVRAAARGGRPGARL